MSEKNQICNILGINVSNYPIKEVKARINAYLNSEKTHLIVTPNPEIILKAIKDEEYFTIINKADLAIPDGIGLKFASWFVGENLQRFTGVELVKYLLQTANSKGCKVAIFNLKNGLSTNREIAEYLRKNYPKLNFITEEADKNWSMSYYENTNINQPEIILANHGNPEQEKFLYHNMPKWDFARILVGIGGTFDFLLNKVSAPKIFRILGLEWLWRGLNIFKYSNRIKRIKRLYNATFIFVYKFIRWRFVLPFFYRPNVMCMLYKKDQGTVKILMVERADQDGHWQLPQGGLDGLSVEDAGFKELSEELGNKNFRFVKSTDFITKYKFPFDLPMHRGAQYKKHTGYKGQKQALYIAEFIGNDSDIMIQAYDHQNWKWVDEDNFLEVLFYRRKEGGEKALNIFKNTIK